MAIAFAYTVATNIVAVTGGTSDVPATFTDFVTADRVGAGTSLLAATAGTNNVTLTYPVRPVELLAIVVKCIVAAKTTETDYIFITGTDAWDAAQTESIDVSAGNGTYTSTKRWRTITNLDCSDNAAGGGTAWADGTIAVTQDIWGVIWNKGGSQYQIDADLNVGDGSTSTYMGSVFEMIYFADAKIPNIKSAATFRLGILYDGYGEQGSYISMRSMTSRTLMDSGTGVLLCYASHLHCRANTAQLLISGGTSYFYESSMSCMYGLSGSSSSHRIVFYGGDFYFRNFYATTMHTFALSAPPLEFTNVFIHHCIVALYLNNGIATVIGIQFAGVDLNKVETSTRAGVGLLAQDLQTALAAADVAIGQTDGYIKQTFKCNIHVADKDGANLSGVTVLCEDTESSTVFSVSTAADGTIAEQIITYKQWLGTSETETAYSPHKFTLSKTGYQTLILENITVDSPIDWHLELQGSSIGQQGMAAGFIN